MPVSGAFSVIASIGESLDTPENHNGVITNFIRQAYSVTDGAGAGNINLVWSDRRTVAASATDTLDLNGGGLLDVFGNAANFATVKGICIFNRETVAATHRIDFAPAAANPFLWTFNAAADRVEIAPSSAYMQWDDSGKATVAGGSDAIRIINTDGANTVTYDIIVIGLTA